MVNNRRNLERLRPLLDRLTASVAAGDAHEFERVLDDLVHARRKDLFSELRRLTTHARSALEAFGANARFADLAEKEVPDARERLRHVLKLTDDAAHQTMDLIDNCGPLVDVIVGPAGATEAPADRQAVLKAANQLRRNLSDMLLAQGYQDLTGQIVRGVVTLVDEIETVLTRLAEVAGDVGGEPGPAKVTVSSNGFGPVVPGVDHGAAVSNQQDVDALLDGLGL
jgi:chemotaxis protein CheZ